MQLDSALARASQQVAADQQDETRHADEAARASRAQQEADQMLLTHAKELAAELVRRAEAMNIAKNRLVKFHTWQQRRWKSRWIPQEREYWFMNLAESTTAVEINLLIDDDANLYRETGSNNRPEPITTDMPRARHALSKFTVERVAEWLAGINRTTWRD
jgi:hypothetical protein